MKQINQEWREPLNKKQRLELDFTKVILVVMLELYPRVKSTDGPRKFHYYVVFDNDFMTVKYIQSGKEPHDWYKLVVDLSEKVTYEQYNTAQTLCEGESISESHETHQNSLVISGNLRETSHTLSEDLIETSHVVLSNNLRETAELNDSNISKPGEPLIFFI